MIALALSGVAFGWDRSINVCVDYSVAFSDARTGLDGLGNPLDGIGDFWDNNSVPRAAIAVEYRITTSGGTYTGNLDTAGCVTRTLSFTGSTTQSFTFKVFSQSNRRDVDIVMRYNDTPDGSGVYWWEDGERLENSWALITTPTTTTFDVTLAATGGWQHLAVATWIIHRSHWNLHQSTVRECCTGSDVNDDGTCDSPPSGDQDPYLRDQDPYLEADPKIFIQGTPGGCCASRMRWDSAPPGTDLWVVGFSGGVGEVRRYTLAHELGHVLVGLRMGGREDTYDNSAPLDGCMGAYTWPPDPPTPMDPDPGGNPTSTSRTKEFMSQAVREGWAEWVSAWTWNSVNGSDCEYKTWWFEDFDLDGDIDNRFNAPDDWKNGTRDCLGTPELFPDPLTGPTGSFVTDINWLGDAIDKGACDSVSAGCTNSTERALMESRNRSSEADWQRMLYQLYKHESLTPLALSDLYVNICPREWRHNDGDCSDGLDLPLNRWELSATELDAYDKISGRLDRVEH